MFCAIEGMDASGKASQSKKLAYWARAQPEIEGRGPRTGLVPRWLKVVELSFPKYDSPTGKAILGHLKSEWQAATIAPILGSTKSGHDALVFQCLQTCNRLENIPIEVWDRDQRNRSFIVSDRYAASAFVYGGLDGLDLNLIARLNGRLPQPDLYFLLDIPVSESVKRRPERRDRYELDLPYLEKVRKRYLEVFQAHSEIGWHVIDGIQDVEAVHFAITQIIKAAL